MQFLLKQFFYSFLEKTNNDRRYNEKIINTFIEQAHTALQKEFSSCPEKPKTFYRSGVLKCDCKFCNQVNAFLPKENVGELIIPGTLKRNIVHIGTLQVSALF